MWFDDVPMKHKPAHSYPGRAKQGPGTANGAMRDAIRERWREVGDACHICGKPIDYSLGMVTNVSTGRKRPHPMGFAVDEIVPASLGGDPLDFSNTRPAHWCCSSRRGGIGA